MILYLETHSFGWRKMTSETRTENKMERTTGSLTQAPGLPGEGESGYGYGRITSGK